MKSYIAIFVVILAASFCDAICYKPETVPSLNVSEYLGVWYQIASDPFTLNTTEKNVVCVYANYSGPDDQGRVGVHNWARISDPVNGRVNQIYGTAFQPDPTNEPGRLVVQLDGVPLPAPYWVLMLGPTNADGLYSFAIVSDEFCVGLYVLSRTPAPPQPDVDVIKAYLAKVGFDVPTQYIPILQEGCVYA